ncbi:retrovirus-related pol polyprotein from transposon TNT 1-94 [Tanacetum coccineum]
MSTARTPKQNSVVERWNRTLVEAARTMLSVAKFPLFLWAEAIATSCFTQNRSLVIPRHEKTPYHIINGRKPSVKFFHIFGSLCYIVGDGENLDKMKEKGTDDEDAHEHVQRVLEIANLFHFPGVTHDAVMLRVFPITLKGPALRWINRLSAGLVTRWDLIEKAFIRQYCPPFKTTKKLEIICNFKQEMDETLYYAWERIVKGHIEPWSTLLKKRTRQLSRASEKVKERTTMGKDYIKEPVPRNLPAQFLGNPYRTRKTICAIGIPKEIKEDKGDINDGSDITIEDVERLRKILTPPIHALSNLKPIVQPYMPLGLVCNKEKVVKEEEQDYDIPLHEHHLNEFGEEFADNTRVSEKIDSNPVNDLKELLKTYDFENFIRKLKHQLSQSSHETGSLYKEMEFEVSLTRVRVVERFCIGVTIKVMS